SLLVSFLFCCNSGTICLNQQEGELTQSSQWRKGDKCFASFAPLRELIGSTTPLTNADSGEMRPNSWTGEDCTKEIV
ncbi:MAG: hypothetical protein KDE53_32470, partial [Caldilineaceae bacterium]|nr:hypothetical protein [Caldilineaceae bacterium]